VSRPEPLPCPFCGNASKLKVHEREGRFVWCWSCAASGPEGKTNADAISLWNRAGER